MDCKDNLRVEKINFGYDLKSKDANNFPYVNYQLFDINMLLLNYITQLCNRCVYFI